MSKKPTVLMILDGYGLNDKCEHNAVCEAKTPIMDQLMSQCPYVKGQASGLAVGLPDGQMGNSEVGHLNMGAGRVVYQELTRITKAIQDGDESWREGNKNTFEIRLIYYADADDAKEGRESEYQYKIHFDDVDGYVIKSEGVPEKEIVFPENK